MTDFIISAFTDEASPSLEGQLEALKRNHLSYVELRNVDGRCVIDFSDEELEELHRVLEAHHISVSAIASPIGKISIREDFAPHFARFRRAVEAAKILKTQRIRIFSFFLSPQDDPKECRAEVLRRLGEICGYANANGVRCCHENEKEIYGDIAARVLDLHETFQEKMAGVFDPANYVQCGVHPQELFPQLLPYTDYLHVKDALFADGSVVPAGKGDAGIGEILDAYHRPGAGRLLSVEPHLFQFGGLSALQNDPLKHKNVYATADEAFDAAVNSLKELLTERGYSYE